MDGERVKRALRNGSGIEVRPACPVDPSSSARTWQWLAVNRCATVHPLESLSASREELRSRLPPRSLVIYVSRFRLRH